MDGRELLEILEECGIDPDEFGFRVNASTYQLERWLSDKEGMPESIIWLAELLRERQSLRRRLGQPEPAADDVLYLGPDAVVSGAATEHRPEPAEEGFAISPEDLDMIYGEYDDSLGMPSYVDEARDDEDGDRSGDLRDFAEPEPVPDVAMAPTMQPPGRRFPKIFRWLFFVVGVPSMIAGFILARDLVVHLWPGTAAVYETIGISAKRLGHGLDIREIRMERASEDGTDLLVVRGIVVNVSGSPRDVPDIRLSLVDGAGEEVQSVSGPAPETRIGAGEATGFEFRMAEPPSAARNIRVGFQRPDDTVGR